MTLPERLSIGITLLAFAGCAGPPRAVSATSASEARCIATDQIIGRRVEAPSSVLFEMNGPVDYVSDVGGTCPAAARLGPSATISIASSGDGGRLCPGDRVRIVDPVEAKGANFNSTPTCVLSPFQMQQGGQRARGEGQ